MTTHKTTAEKAPDYTALLIALAKANQHPDPEAFAKQVSDLLGGK